MKLLGRILLLVCFAAICAIYIPMLIKAIQELNAAGWVELFGENQKPFSQFLASILMFIFAIIALVSVITGVRNPAFLGYCLGVILVHVVFAVMGFIKGTTTWDTLDYIGLGTTLLIPITGFFGNLFLGKPY